MWTTPFLRDMKAQGRRIVPFEGRLIQRFSGNERGNAAGARARFRIFAGTSPGFVRIPPRAAGTPGECCCAAGWCFACGTAIPVFCGCGWAVDFDMERKYR